MWFGTSRASCLGLTSLMLAACGATATPSAQSCPARRSLEKDPAGKISIVAAAAAVLPKPEPKDDEDQPEIDCKAASDQYTKAYAGLNGMVEWHRVFSLESFKEAERQARAANDKECSPNFVAKERDCGEIIGAFKHAYQELMGTPEWRTLSGTIEWRSVLQAYQILQIGNCID